MSVSLYIQTLECLMLADPTLKVAATRALYQAWQATEVTLEADTPVRAITVPGRPDQPELVSPREVPRRSFKSATGRLRLAHAITHIEFNAINLALDAVYRFRGLPPAYYADWLRVASEEALHFSLLREYLQSHGSDYGAYPAHNGLWEMALKTDHDALTRMALVPRVLEARGLDVTQQMITRLEAEADHELAAILKIIYRDEIGHVEIGSRWFKYLCELSQQDSVETFARLLIEYGQDKLNGPMDELARRQAGFTSQELDFLAGRS